MPRPRSSGSPLRRAFFALVLLPLFTTPSHAQRACETGPISFIFIDNHSIFDTDDPALDSRFAWAYRAANALHVRTKRRVIERELLFGPGDCYDPYLLEETERLLRGYDFLSQVGVFGIPQPDGSYHVVVDTRDQWSTSLDLRVGFDRGLTFEGIRLRESNLLGTGQELGLFYIDRDVTRDYGVAYGTRQLAGTRWDLNASLGRTRAGSFFTQSIAYPFVGEVGQWGARQSFSREDQFFDYISVDSTRGESQHVLLPVREKLFDVAIGTRFGKRGNLTVLGAMLSYEELTYPGEVQVAEGDNFEDRTAVGSALAAQIQAQTEQLGSIRVGIVLGQRNVWWVKKRGFDSMRGQQDVPLGADVALAFGRSLPALERDDDLVGTFRLYTGIEAGDALFAARVRLDARRDFDATASASEWADVYADGELLNYWKPPALPRHTFFLRLAGAGGWNTRTPFQLTLGGDRNLRGYRHERFPGGRRLIVNAEDRIYIGWPLREVLDLGGTLFVDAGRIWPGDVPFGEDSGWRATAGLGLRGSFPAGGRSTFRIDVATPLDTGLGFSNFRLIISASELLGLRAVNAPDVQLVRSRNEGVEGALFRMRGQ
ncbi:MAG: hypothetical protein ACT443_12130 [Gemmatimonadota bacterium]